MLPQLVLIVILGSASASATPIQPDLRKILSEPHKNENFPAARAGWNGPETAPSPQASPNPALEKYGPAANARAIRQTLRELLTPDWRALAAITAVILLLRMLRARHEQELDRDSMPASISAAQLERPAA